MAAKLSRLSWIWACLIALPITVVYWHISTPEGGRWADFTTGYYAAADTVWHKGSLALWPLTEQGWLVNLPIVAWAFAPFAWLGPRGAILTYAGLGLLATGITLLMTADSCPPRLRPLVFLLFAVNGPLWYSFLIGNSTHFILLLLVSSLALWKHRRLATAGFLLGICTVIKPMILLLVAYFAWRRNWRVVFAAITVVVFALIATVAVFGIEYFIGWYQHDVTPFAGKPMGAHNVQSFEAFLLRLTVGPKLLFNFRPQTLPFPVSLIAKGVIGGLAALIAWAMWRGRRASERHIAHTPRGADYLEFCLMLVFCVTMSTVSWTHYYLLFLLPWSLYLAGRLPLCDDRLTHILIWGSIIICSLPFHYPRPESGWFAAISSRSFQSVWLFGGLLLLWALLRSAIQRPEKDLSPWLPRYFKA
jgi:hypothetical protein